MLFRAPKVWNVHIGLRAMGDSVRDSLHVAKIQRGVLKIELQRMFYAPLGTRPGGRFITFVLVALSFSLSLPLSLSSSLDVFSCFFPLSPFVPFSLSLSPLPLSPLSVRACA